MIKYDTPYIILRDTDRNMVGKTVYRASGCDYGCSSDDSRMTGIPHVSMTLDENGGYPFFTMSEYDLKEIQ